jgi:hypothetical protein
MRNMSGMGGAVLVILASRGGEERRIRICSTRVCGIV